MKYRVVLRPEGGKWNAEVPKVRGCVTWGRSLGETRRNVIEAIAGLVAAEGGDPARVERDAELVEAFELPPRTQRKLAAAREARAAAAEADSRANAATAAAVTALIEAGLSTRDIGELLGLSHQRIHQLKTPRRSPVGKASKARALVVREQPALIVAEPQRSRRKA